MGDYSARLGVSLAPGKLLPVAAVVELSRLAERLGYESVWIPETWGVDAVSALALIAAGTERIKLASGVFNVFSRSAALLAQTAATLQEISNGRFILGLGSSGPGVVEPWHGVLFRRPVQRTREYVAVLRMALAGERVDYQGEQLRLAGFRLGNPPSMPTPIYIAALGPQNVHLTGEVADGWLPIFAARGQLATMLVSLRAGAKRVGRDPNGVDIAAYLPAAVAEGGERLLRQQIAYYVGGMGTFYADFVSRIGFGEEASQIGKLWQSGDRRAAVAAVDDRLLEACTLGTNPVEARVRLNSYRDEGVGLPIVVPAHGSSAQQIADLIEAIAPL